jgi:predicted dehydrogenase
MTEQGRKARIGIVGIGWWASFMHIPEVMKSPHADLVAICDLDPERVRVAGEHFGIADRYTDLTEMLARENLDGVIVGTPHVAHTAPAVAALEARAHVLVEKPMATTAADGRLIAATAMRVGREVMVPTGLNFTRYSRRAADWVRTGRIGEVRHAACQMGSPLDDLMAGKPMLETKEHLFRPPASTWADPKKAGGYGWGQMSHSLAWLVYVTDLRFETVACMDVKSPAGVDYYDAAIARASNGATVSISGASTVPKHVGMHTDVRIYGTEGMIHFCNLPARLELRRHDGADESMPLTDFEGLYDGGLPVRVFCEMCAGLPVENASNGECGARVTECIDALYRSAAGGQIVRIGGE